MWWIAGGIIIANVLIVLFFKGAGGEKSKKAKDYCTDRACYAKKERAVVERHRQKLADVPHLEVTDEYSNSAPKNALRPWQFQECSKKEKGAQQMLVVAGKHPGRLFWGKVHESGSSRYVPTAEEIKQQQKQELERESAQEFRRRLWIEVVAGIRARSSVSGGHLPLDFLRIAAKKALCMAIDTCDDEEQFFGELGARDMNEAFIRIDELDEVELGVCLMRTLMEDDRDGYFLRNSIDSPFVCAGVLGLDLKMMKKEARAEVVRKRKAARNQKQESGSGEASKKATPGVCRVCGCTEDNCQQCVEKAGEPCHWVDETRTLCSACAAEREEEGAESE